MDINLLASGFKRFDLELALGNFEVKDDRVKALAFNDKEIELDPDLQYIKFILCHEGANANGDFFTKDVLQQAQFTPKYKPVDWEHGQPLIGTMLDSRYAEDENGVAYIEAIGVVWKFIYPELSEQIKAKSSTGELKLSMECYYKDANYLVGDNIYDQATAEDLGLVDYVGRLYMGKPVYRVFKEVVFGGVGVVANPADKEAVFLAVAKDLESRNLPELHPVKDFTQNQPSREIQNSMIVAQYLKSFDKAKSQIIGKFNNDQLRTKERLAKEVADVLDAFYKELIGIHHSYAMESEDNPSKEDTEVKDQQANVENKLIDNLDSELEEQYETELANPDDNSVGKQPSFEGVTQADDMSDEEAEVKKKAIDPEKEEAEVKKDYIDPESEKANDSQVPPKKYQNKNNNTPSNDPDQKLDDESHAEVKEGNPVVNVGSPEEYTQKDHGGNSYEAQFHAQSKVLEELQAKFDAVVAELNQFKQKEIASARKAEIIGFGISISESRLEKLIAMDSQAYEEAKELLLEVAGIKLETANEDIETAIASEEEVQEVKVEGVQIRSAGFNLEAPSKNYKPFGHLSL